jgi:transcriptional regulator with XRE-family HTH domain
MDIGNKLKTLRVQKKLEPINMAELLKISVNTYRKYERNESAPDTNMLEKIAKIHEIEVSDLLKNDKYIFNNNENKDCNINNLVINNLSEKVIELYEKRLEDKDVIIAGKDEIIASLKQQLGQ